MQKLNILITGSDPEILATVARLINNNPLWHAICATTVDEVIDLLKAEPIELLMIGAGLSADEEVYLINACRQGRVIPVTRHYGGGSGLLLAEVEMAVRYYGCNF